MFETFDTQEFGNYLKNLRESLKITQNNVKELTGLSLETIRKLERGISIPRYDTLELLSKVYKVDVLQIFSLYRSSSDLYSFYNNLDHLIVEYNQEKLTNLLEDFQNRISEETAEKVFEKKELKQFILILKGIEAYSTEERKEACYDYFIEAMKIGNSSFELKNINRFKYTQLEHRILLLIALALSFKRELKLANKILILSLETNQLKCRLDFNDIRLMIKIYFNLSYNFFGDEDYQNSLKYADEGIKYCQKHHSMYALSGLFYRRGIAKFFMEVDDYMTDLTYAMQLFYINDQFDLAKLYQDITFEKYGIKIKI
ncbi:MAG: helix-turn-helix transcriptional regulator [Clostridiales bacterium]|nr:helix-turn-helix transcriptional regulator [Clostridiales bacterium]